MPIYLYRCPECGNERDSQLRGDIQSCICGGISRRVFSANITGTTFKPHFNHSVGSYVTSSRHFDDLLKRRSEENTIRTGAEHSYTRIDPGDQAFHPQGDTQNLEDSARIKRAKGIDQPSTTRIFSG